MNVPHPIRLFDLEEVAIEDFHPEPIQEGLSHEVFKYIRPGKERVCVILKAEDFNYGEIAFILGIKRQEVNKIMFDIKNRLIKLGLGKMPSK